MIPMKTTHLILPVFLLLGSLVACSGDDSPMSPDDSGQDGEVEFLTTPEGIEFVRTPDTAFQSLPDWPYESRYVEIDGLRQAYVEDGPSDGPVVLLLHGQPSWSYLYRKMIPVLANAGYRVIAMDHLGMGRSDKPTDIDVYTYLYHNERLERFIQDLGLRDINLFVQDWGSLIGLRVAGLHPEWFATIAVGDGSLPIFPEGQDVFPPVEDPEGIVDIPSPFATFPEQQVPFYDGCEVLFGPEEGYFGNWMTYAMKAESFHASEVVEAMTWFDLSPEEEAAYDAPFPSREYMAGVRKFPSCINGVPGTTQQAWIGLSSFTRPFLTIWASNDPGQLGSCEAQQLFIDNVPGAAGQDHVRLPEASHFLQDDQGPEIARRLVDFYRSATEEEVRVGFEILEIRSADEFIVWLNVDGMSRDEFENLDLPQGWIKNQPRETDPSGGVFLRSPDASEDGEFTEATHFGHRWRHNATVIETGIPLDDEGLLSGNRIAKFHRVSFDAGQTIHLLVSPEGDAYIRISRDAGRTQEVPTIPSTWLTASEVLEQDLDILLPNPTLNIRADNEDSFQGPLPQSSGAP
jgi:pimeloyl-ACP methyl ester carboxylesterase